MTRVTREVSRQPGSTRRMTVAVLVNGVPEENAGGEVQMVPRSEGELDVLRELVASAVGFDEARGDQITVKSLPFAGLGQDGTSAAPGWMDRLELNGLARILLIEIVFYGIGALAQAILNSRGVFGPPAWAPVAERAARHPLRPQGCCRDPRPATTRRRPHDRNPRHAGRRRHPARPSNWRCPRPIRSPGCAA